jgi:hypothetical protein
MIRDENYYARSRKTKAKSTLIIWSMHARPSMDQCVPPWLYRDRRDDRASSMFSYRAWWNRVSSGSGSDRPGHARSTRTCISSPVCTFLVRRWVLYGTCVHSPDTVPVRVTYRTVRLKNVHLTRCDGCSSSPIVDQGELTFSHRKRLDI